MQAMIIELGLDVEIYLANRHEGNLTSNLGGTLNLYNLDTPEMDFEAVESDSDPIPVIIDDNYTVRTNNYELQGERHLKWNGDREDYLLEKTNFVLTEDIVGSGLNAIFNFQEQVAITSANDVEIQFHDPWFLENPEADPSDWNQPDAFLPLSEQIDENGNIQVFLEQGNINDPNDPSPIYHIKAPKYYASQDAIYEFSGWTVTPENSATLNINDHNTPVVFHQADATISPTYNTQINHQAGTYIIEEGDILSIPPGAVIPFKSTTHSDNYIHYFPHEYDDIDGCVLYVNGELNIGENSILMGDGNGLWGGIQLGPNASVSLNNTTIKNAFVGIQLLGSSDEEDRLISIKRVIFDNNLVGLWSFQHYGSNDCLYFTDFVQVNNCTFVNNQYSIYTNAFDGTGECIDPNASGGFDIRLKNNIFYQSNAMLLLINQLNSSYNWFFESNALNNYDLDDTNIFEGSDPLFTHILQGDYSLMPNSPCIDAGHPDLDGDGLTWENDIDDQDPDGSRMDLGYVYRHQITGDINVNGTTDVDDITSLVDIILGITEPTPTQTQIADLDYTNSIDIFDLFLLIDYILEGNMDYVAPEGTIYYTQITRQREYPPYILTVSMYCDVPVRGLQMTLDIPDSYDVDDGYIIPGDFAVSENMQLEYNYIDKKSDESIKYLYYSPMAAEFAPGSGDIIDIGMTRAGSMGNGRIDQDNVTPITLEAMGIGKNGSKLNMVELSPEDFEQMIANNEKNATPETYSMYPSYPNPFNPTTTLKYDIPENSHIKLTVFDLSGRVVTELMNQSIMAGTHHSIWNGKDKNGRSVSSGVYLIQMKAISTNGKKHFTNSQKIVLLK